MTRWMVPKELPSTCAQQMEGHPRTTIKRRGGMPVGICIRINRKLEKGFCDSLYGIEVARFILDKPEFIQQAFKIRNYLLEEHQDIVSCKTSRYNRDVYMDRCQWGGCKETKS